MMVAANDPADTPRRRQLIEAAGRLFRAKGFRAVTMEAIAAEAGAAKATLYSHFPDKGAVFAAVADRAIQHIASALSHGLGFGGSVEDRLLHGLIARHKAIFELVDRSLHTRELMTARDAFARTLVDKVDVQMIGALAAVLREDRAFAKAATSIASTLFYGCIGVCGRARNEDDIDTEIAGFVRAYLVGVRALADQGGSANMKRDRGAPEHLRRAAGSGRK